MENSELEVWDFEEFEDFDEEDDDESFGIDDADESEFDELEGEDFEPYGEDSAEGRKSRRRRAARRRALAARRRQALAQSRRASKRRPLRPARKATPARKIASNRAKIQKVGLESAVKTDVLARHLGAHSKRIGGTENSITASKVVEELSAQFPDLLTNKFVKTGLPLAPLFFLKPPKKGSGVESFARDPRVWGTLLAAGAALISELREKEPGPQEIAVTPAGAVLQVGNTFKLNAIVRDRSGKIIKGRALQWDTLNAAFASIDANTGLVTAVAKGPVTITATDVATGLMNAVTITVQ